MDGTDLMKNLRTSHDDVEIPLVDFHPSYLYRVPVRNAIMSSSAVSWFLRTVLLVLALAPIVLADNNLFAGCYSALPSGSDPPATGGPTRPNSDACMVRCTHCSAFPLHLTPSSIKLGPALKLTYRHTAVQSQRHIHTTTRRAASVSAATARPTSNSCKLATPMPAG